MCFVYPTSVSIELAKFLGSSSYIYNISKNSESYYPLKFPLHQVHAMVAINIYVTRPEKTLHISMQILAYF